MLSEPRVVTVSQVTDYLRLLVEGDAFLSNLWVEGDVSNVFLSRAGHLYFTLGDGESSLKAVAFRASAMRVQHAVTEGAHLVVGGRASVYGRDGNCQIYVDYADSSGMGAHALALARLRALLEAEGLFDVDRKRPLPAFPRRIAVVTSPSGAVIHDIQTVLRRRFPLAELLIAPAQVQGNGAVDSLLQGLDLVLEDGRADLVIFARGGGSAEDLAAFNDERLARAVFACPIPVISAIGHETDFSILDEVADLRAPTPTAAAELATPDIADLAFDLVDARERASRTVLHALTMKRFDIDQAVQRLDRSSPLSVLTRHRERLSTDRQRLASSLGNHVIQARGDARLDRIRLSNARLRVIDRQVADIGQVRERVNYLFAGRMQQARASLDVNMARLHEMNPVALLGRGFAVVTDGDGRVIDSIASIGPGQAIRAVVRDGTIRANVTDVQPGIA